ncbi:MAG: ASKHA domain-containing protein [Anaerolineales bacterium]
MPDALTHTLVLTPSGRRGAVAHGANLLDAARSLGVELESICGGRQTCGKCQVVVEEGHFAKHGLTSTAAHATPSVRADTVIAQALPGRVLACACTVSGDLLITVPEESQARKQIIAKAATERAIEVLPAVRQVYVEVPAASLHDTGGQGDWERVQAALAEQWQLPAVVCDARVLARLQGVLRDRRAALPDERRGLTLTLWQDQEVLRVEPGYAEGVYGLAVDVGSTTLVVHLCDLRTGAVLATEAAMNPQVRYGEDLMSRVSYGMMDPQGVARLNRSVIGALNELAAGAAEKAHLTPDDLLDMVVVGNPIMIHLVLGIDPVELGGSPFALAVASPLDLKARDLGLKLNPAARVHVLPAIAGHVGADSLGVQLAEAPHLQDGQMLIIDVGTNAEIVLGSRKQMYCASSPTGPAFEGAQITHGQRAAPGAIERVRIDPQTLEPRLHIIGATGWLEADGAQEDRIGAGATRITGICGSGIIEAVAELYLAGIIDQDGRFDEGAAARTPRVRFKGRTGEYVLVVAADSATGADIVVNQSDVRAIQLAKAALYAGVKLLMTAAGIFEVDRVVLAGAFGTFISPFHAMALGLIPDCDLDKVTAVGNAAGDGARIALLNVNQRREAARLAHWVQHVQTATAAEFQNEFVAALGLPHASDAFPHLAGRLPARAAAGERGSARRRRTAVQT